ncbi:AAA family ATPase [Gemmobacter fulvus]|uniref:AAA family ATPase n=1 Tax=Gemmobacter fulvus TaxID=2840474 RepID=A0A975P948_9RHOB|nr:AAA family ATPase [Gemmobacter fulvus]MBT9244930.1 AAA family ATPase [Gemmobacter fulvus]QWK90716.1 AAA family ATPase [Gemmobacter fulvus]
MVAVLSLFNHKGGVSKTTTAFNLGWMLARKGKRVMLVDCDPQCNLTGMVLGLEDLETSDSIQGMDAGVPLNIKEGLVPAFESRPSPIVPVRLVSIPKNDNLFLLPGNIGLAEYEVTLGISQELSGSVVTLRNLPGAINHLLKMTAAENNIDIAIVDMSPSLGALNQNLLSISDFFIIPMHPDYFSNMAVKSLANVIPKWKSWADAAASTTALKDAAYPFPDVSTKFIGYVVQKYRPRAKAPSRAFQSWIDQLESNVRDTLLPVLSKSGLLLPQEIYAAANIDPSIPILQMPDFNSLIAFSQEHQVPIFELTPDQLKQVGKVLENTQGSQEDFLRLFDECADKVIAVLNAAGT